MSCCLKLDRTVSVLLLDHTYFCVIYSVPAVYLTYVSLEQPAFLLLQEASVFLYIILYFPHYT